MARPLSAAMLAAIQAQTVRLAVLCEMDFKSGTVYVWTGTYTLTWNGHDFIGLGSLGTVSKIVETGDGSASGINLMLSNIPSSLIAAALEEGYQGQPVHLWMACFDNNWQLLSSPYKLFQGMMDIMTIQDGNPTGSISVACESRMVELNRPRIRRFTDGDQRIDFPADDGFKFVNGIQLVQIFWGNPNGPTANLPGSAQPVLNLT